MREKTTKPWNITKEQVTEARKWWSDLSINQMKAFVKKHCPAFFTNWTLVPQMPSFLVDIYEQEKGGVNQ